MNPCSCQMCDPCLPSKSMVHWELFTVIWTPQDRTHRVVVTPAHLAGGEQTDTCYDLMTGRYCADCILFGVN